VVMKPPAGACKGSGCAPGNSGVVRDCAVGKRHARSGEAFPPRPREPVGAIRYEKSWRAATRLKLSTVRGRDPTSSWTPKGRGTEPPEVWWRGGVTANIGAR
jgi:hypothetical protein